MNEKRIEVSRDLVLRVMMKNMDCLSDYLWLRLILTSEFV